jgi:glycosyltransferase involved in cell wall biosynthesis
MDGVNVIRVPSLPYHGVSPLPKGIGQVLLSVSFSIAGLSMWGYDAVIAYSPPLFLGLAACFLARLYGGVPVVNVQDLFPKEAVDIGMLKNKYLIRFFEWMERLTYNVSLVTVHSERNRRHVLNVRTRKNNEDVAVVHNWVKTELYSPATSSEREKIKAEMLGTPGKFVCMFAGVMGFCQDIGVIVGAANLLRDYPQIHFLLLGDGVEKESQINRAQRLGLKNIEFRPFVPADQYPRLLRGVDCGIATLRKELGTPVIPSKILGFMAAGKPVVASLNAESDAIELIKTAGSGICTEPGDPSSLANAVLALYRDRGLAESLGQKGRAYVTQHCTLDEAVSRYEWLLDHGARSRKKHSQPSPQFAKPGHPQIGSVSHGS